MSYTPTEWQTGDVITAEKLNKAEQGIKDAHNNAADISSEISTEVASWLDEHINVTEGVNIDDTLSVAGSAADSKATGDELSDLKSSYNPVDKTAEMTQPVGKDSNGRLWTAPGSGGGDGAGITKTATGTSLTIDAIAGTPKSLTVAFDWSQGDVSNISPSAPVPITTAKNCTITVNGDDFYQDFTGDVGTAGIGAGSWNVLTGSVAVTQKAIIVTADMVRSLARVSGEEYAAVLNLGTPVYAAGGGVLACSHYKIGSNPGIWLRNGTLYLYGGFANDLEAVKTYVAGLNMTVVFAIETPEQYSLPSQQINLVAGDNVIGVDAGTITVVYGVDLQKYIDDQDAATAEIANQALEIAEDVSDQVAPLIAEVDTINDNLYKYRTESGSNTGTGSATTSANIHWGLLVDVDPLIEKCKSVSIIPACNNTTAGTYTATRWKNGSGNALVNGETLTFVESKTAAKGESVTFDDVSIGEFISIEFSSGSTQRTQDTTQASAVKARIGHINPATGVYTSFNGYLSGDFTFVFYKAIVNDCMSLFGKKITLIGDSITEKNGRADVNHGMWLERWTGCQIQNLGQGGTGFARTPGSTNYKLRISRVSADADIIGVAASFNDMIYSVGTPTDTAADNTVCGYANEFFDELIAAFPTTRICCYSEGPWYNYHPGITASDNLMAALKTICEAHGVVWDDGLYRGCALRPWLQANCEVYYKGESGTYVDVVDNVHPNSAGQQVIARWLERLFEKVVD